MIVWAPPDGARPSVRAISAAVYCTLATFAGPGRLVNVPATCTAILGMV